MRTTTNCKLIRIATSYIILAVMLMMTGIDAQATKQVPEKNFPEWSSVTISGKLKAAGLPVRPSMKIFMKHNELIRIAISAPFVGEVARIEIIADEFIAINKMKNTYCREYLHDILPASVSQQLILSNIQDIILGRPTTIGNTAFTTSGPGIDTGYDEEEDMTWAMRNYIFDGHPVALLQMFDTTDMLARQYIIGLQPDSQDSATEWVMKFDYSADSNKKNIEIGAEFHNHALPAMILECNPPKWGVEGIDPPHITSKMKRVGIREFISKF